MSVIETFARRIYVRWEAWEADAGQQAQAHQDTDGRDELMVSLIAQELTALVEQAALVCEGRADARRDRIPIYAEAMKCADQIRHNLTK
jgi:hypothetical protein